VHPNREGTRRGWGLVVKKRNADRGGGGKWHTKKTGEAKRYINPQARGKKKCWGQGTGGKKRKTGETPGGGGDLCGDSDKRGREATKGERITNESHKR